MYGRLLNDSALPIIENLRKKRASKTAAQKVNQCKNFGEDEMS